MGNDNIRGLRSLEPWSSTLVLAGGVSLAGHGAINAIEAFTNTPAPPDVFAPAGYLLAVVGLLGLAPGLVEDAPRIGRGAVVAGSMAIVGWLAVLSELVGTAFGIASPVGPLPEYVWLPVIVSMFATYVLFAAGFRSARQTYRSVWVFLLVPPGLLVALLIGATLVGAPEVGAFLIGAGQCIAHLSLGVVLRRTTPATVTPTADDASTG